MKANETRVEDFLSSNKTQFVIPVYQRNYDWSISQCKQLLDDVLEVGWNPNMNAHFIGSVVYIHDDVYSSSRIKELSIIDGQQRLTTLTLLYLVILRVAIEIKNKELEYEIRDTYLINKYTADEEKLKLRPTEDNDKALKFLLRSDLNEEYKDFSKLIDNFNYFKGRITEENLDYVLRGLSKLIFVEISLERGKDDPQRIFESLNSTGLELSQADLIRNYILMGLKPKDQKDIYDNYWETIEKLAKDETNNISKVSDFIRDYLTLITNKIPNKNKVYLEFKNSYPTNTIDRLYENLSPIKSLVKFYNKLINPDNETDNDIKLQLDYINRLEINVAYPFLMKVYEDYHNDIISKATFIEILQFIQSFSWRRFIVGLPTNALNKIFMNLYDKVDANNYVFSIKKYLTKKSGTTRFPNNKEFVDSLKLKDVYNIKSKNRTYLFERIENFENNEPVVINGNSDITIEHIFPQNPDPKWKVSLGLNEYNLIKENYLNTIGNLTLSGNNGKMGNKHFLFKRDLKKAGYKDSRLWLNKFLSKQDKWDTNGIEKRFEELSNRILKIWEYPEIESDDNDQTDEINIFEAEDPTYKKLEYVIFFNQKIELKQVTHLYLEVMKQFFDLQPETFFTTELAEKIGLTKSPKPGTPWQPLQINDTYFIEGKMDSQRKFERIKLALSIFDSEEELIIRFADNKKPKSLKNKSQYSIETFK